VFTINKIIDYLEKNIVQVMIENVLFSLIKYTRTFIIQYFTILFKILIEKKLFIIYKKFTILINLECIKWIIFSVANHTVNHNSM